MGIHSSWNEHCKRNGQLTFGKLSAAVARHSSPLIERTHLTNRHCSTKSMQDACQEALQVVMQASDYERHGLQLASARGLRTLSRASQVREHHPQPCSPTWRGRVLEAHILQDIRASSWIKGHTGQSEPKSTRREDRVGIHTQESIQQTGLGCYRVSLGALSISGID